ncbi:MAG: pyruvate, phosphate dikinase [Ahrensia sp.]|nr:pyruvate, phosphate dikinase [Ahrensia sp.]
MTSQSTPIFRFGLGGEAPSVDVETMGNKGAGLVEMSTLGLPVPPGFILGTQLGASLKSAGDLSDDVIAALRAALQELEAKTGRRFGDMSDPLLVSVRSGAAVSMPGMMDTVLNLGLNGRTVEAMAQTIGGERFAWDSYRRFIQSFAQVVLGLDDDPFEIALETMRDQHGVDSDSDLPDEVLKEIGARFEAIVEEETGERFPQDLETQLQLAVLAVFRSWNTSRARTFRAMQNIPDDGGTAAIVQAMVFGNRDNMSCSGVYFTRNPSTGANKPFGEYVVNAQGEDVVSGLRTPRELTEEARLAAMSDEPSMERLFPQAYEELVALGHRLEAHYGDLQEIEFTMEAGTLYLLQTRRGKRNPKAALRVAVEMVREGIISRADAVARCGDDMLAPMLVEKVDHGGARPFTKGLAASPGAVSGKIAFTSQSAIDRQEASEVAILVRPETDPRDVHGMNAARGIVTARGGMTSHAAVVARGMGKPCITAAMSLKIDLADASCSSLGQTLREGDVITIDGSTGMVFVGELPRIKPEPDGDLATLLEWKDELDG